MPSIRDILPQPPWEGPPIPKIYSVKPDLGSKADQWWRILRQLESELHQLRYQLKPYIADNRVACLDNEIRDTLEHLSNSGRLARQLVAEEKYK